MEYKDLPNIIILLVTVGMLIGVGLITLNSLENSDSSKISTIELNETIAISSLVGTTANGQVTGVTFFGNGTYNTTEGNLVIGTTVNVTTTGVKANVSDGNYIIDYVYDANTTATTAIHDTNASLASIPSTWLPLLIVVAMLAIILVLVLRSFGGNAGRK